MALRNGGGYVVSDSSRNTIIRSGIASTSRQTQLAGITLSNKTHSNYTRGTMVTSGKARWTCRVCGKMLSSKRSFDEHSNIHNRSRPFACEHCDYAAASQMTLRRHNLRNHTPRQAWGYQCPYCPELYMEPASYQQHVASRHFGKSATFGCPLEGCSFTTRCCGYFKDHLIKHRNLPKSFLRFTSLGNSSALSRFLVEDKLGVGFGKRPLKQIVRPSFLAKVAEEERLYQEYMKTPINCDKLQYCSHLGSRSEMNHSSESHNAQRCARKTVIARPSEHTRNEDVMQSDDAFVLYDAQKWIAEDIGCLEIVVDDSQNAPAVLHEGMVEPELD